MRQSLLAALLLVALATGGAAQSDICRAGETQWERPGTYMGATTDGIGLLLSDKYLLAFAHNNGSTIWRRRSSFSPSRAICFFKNDRNILVSSILPREREMLYGLMDSATGKYLWKRVVPERRGNGESFDCDALQSLDYFELRRLWRSTYVSKADGAVLWDDNDIRGQYGYPLITENDLLVYFPSSRPVNLLEGRQPTTGNLLWRRELESLRSFTGVYRGILYHDTYQNITAIDPTTGLSLWSVEGVRINNRDATVVGPLLFEIVDENMVCSFDRLTGEKIWCAKFRGFISDSRIVKGSEDVMLTVIDGFRTELLRIHHRTGRVLYAVTQKDQSVIDVGADAFFFDAVRPERTETYFTDAGLIARMAADGTKLWVTSVPDSPFRPSSNPCFIWEIVYVEGQGDQRVFQFAHCNGSGLIALHYKTGRVAWLIYESRTLIGFEWIDDFRQNVASMYHDENVAVFSTEPTRFRAFDPPRAGVGTGTVRAIRTRC